MASRGRATDRLAVVTGTTSGVGLAVARGLLERDWRVLGIARRASPIDHREYEHVQVDLSAVELLADSLEAILTTHLADTSLSRIGLVNNAADPALLGPITHLDARRLGDVFATNVAAPVWLMGVLVRRAPPAAALRIVNVSTGAAVRAFPGLAAYGGSKSALRMAGMVLAAELDSDPSASEQRLDVSILSYEPGTVDTPMQAHARAQSAAILPSVELFRRFAADRQLVSPNAPAREIVAFLESGPTARFHERRLA